MKPSPARAGRACPVATVAVRTDPLGPRRCGPQPGAGLASTRLPADEADHPHAPGEGVDLVDLEPGVSVRSRDPHADLGLEPNLEDPRPGGCRSRRPAGLTGGGAHRPGCSPPAARDAAGSRPRNPPFHSPN